MGLLIIALFPNAPHTPAFIKVGQIGKNSETSSLILVQEYLKAF